MAKINERKKQKMTSFLPDLVTDILLRLPVMSLLRFRCLSASVCTEIDSACFVKNHLNRSIQSKTGQKLIIRYSENFADDLRVTAPLNKPPSESPPHFTFLCGPCNGLILSMIILVENDTFFNFVIWNPFTRQYKKLPLHPVQTLPARHKTITRYGLGYDSTLDDYKFVMITEVSHVSFQVWIFSLKSNSWRKSQDLPMVDNKRSSQVGSFADGALYWKWKDNVLGFDVAHEVFFEVPLFSDCGQTITCADNLVVLAGNLYVRVVLRAYSNIHYYLLVRDKGGEGAGGSWRKKFTLDYKMRNFDLLAYSEEGNCILVSKLWRIFWYNLEKKTKKCVAANVPLYSEEVCCESLVSLGDDSAFDGAADKVVIYDLER